MLLYFEGDLVNWQHINPFKKEEFLNLVEKNANVVAHKLSVLTPNISADHPVDPSVPINHQVALLTEAASSSQHLSQVDPTYSPWF